MKVLNKRTDVIPPDAILVDRTTKWGNPFKIGETYIATNPQAIFFNITREQSIQLYGAWLSNRPNGQVILKDIKELEGTDLVCWCAPLPCHADILLELANK